MRFVLDNSVVQRFSEPRVRDAVEAPRVDHELVICVPTLLEVGVSARDEADHLRQWQYLAAAMRVLHGSEEVDVRARTIQGRLVAQGQHRGPGPVDILVAAHAAAAGAAVLHHDRDFELVEECSGVLQRWVLPRGTTTWGTDRQRGRPAPPVAVLARLVIARTRRRGKRGSTRPGTPSRTRRRWATRRRDWRP